MNTKEFIESAAKNPGIFESLRNASSLEQMYALAKEFGLSDSEKDFLQYLEQACEDCAPVELSALFQVAGGSRNNADSPFAADDGVYNPDAIIERCDDSIKNIAGSSDRIRASDRIKASDRFIAPDIVAP